MFFFLSKTLDVALSPLTWAFVALAFALRPAATRRAKIAATAGALAILYVFSNEMVAELVWRSLERGAASTYRPGANYDAVIVLGGVADRGRDSDYALSYNENVERVLAAYEVMRKGDARYALFSSGPLNPPGRAASEADLMAEQLARWGIANESLVVEPRSRNTRENAVESAAIVRERGWQRLAVITSAFHMPRAIGCFHAVGLYPDALPVDYRAPPAGVPELSLLPRADSLARNTAALREFAGRLIYRVRGYSKG